MRLKILTVAVIAALTVIVLFTLINRKPADLQAPVESIEREKAEHLSEKIIAPGESQMAITLKLPSTLKFVADTPPRLSIYSADPAVLYPGPPENSDPKEPFLAPYRAYAGSTDLTIQYRVYCCEEGPKAICFSREGTILVPVKISDDGADSLKISYLIDE